MWAGSKFEVSSLAGSKKHEVSYPAPERCLNGSKSLSGSTLIQLKKLIRLKNLNFRDIFETPSMKIVHKLTNNRKKRPEKSLIVSQLDKQVTDALDFTPNFS